MGTTRPVKWAEREARGESTGRLSRSLRTLTRPTRGVVEKLSRRASTLAGGETAGERSGETAPPTEATEAAVPTGPLGPDEADGRRRPRAPVVVVAGSPAAAEAQRDHPGMTVDVTGAVTHERLWEWLNEPRETADTAMGGDELLLGLVQPVLLGGQLVLSYELGCLRSELLQLSHEAAAQARAEAIGAEVFARACSWALGTPLHRSSPLAAALATGLPVAVHLFSGRRRGRAGLAAKLAGRGWAVAAYDIIEDKEHGDLTCKSVTDPIFAAAKVGWVRRGFSGCPCESFTVLRFNPPRPGQKECPPLRYRSWLPSWPPLPDGWEDYMAMHEGFVELTFAVGDAILEWPDGRYGVEGPIDRADEEGRPRFFRKKWAEHVPLERHPRAVQFIGKHGARCVDICQCMSAGPFQKATTLISDAETSAAWEGACLPCVHEDGEHKEQAYGEDENGESRSARSAEYPEGMCEWLAVGLGGGTRAEVHEAALAAAEPVLHAIGPERAAAYDRALRAAAGPRGGTSAEAGEAVEAAAAADTAAGQQPGECGRTDAG